MLLKTILSQFNSPPVLAAYFPETRSMNGTIFREVTLCIQIEVYRRFLATYFLHFQDRGGIQRQN
jgi:hypothetical protein